MPASYPTSAKSFSAKLNGDVIAVGHVTDLEAEVTAVETALVAGLPVTHGGTGVTTRTAYGVIVGGTTATGATQTVTPGTSGYLLTSGGASAVPTWTAAVTASAGIEQAFRGLQVRTSPNADVAATTVSVLGLTQWTADDGTLVDDTLTNNTAVISSSGAGGLDTGSEAASTWYEIYRIRKSSDGTLNTLLHRAKDYFLDESQVLAIDASLELRNTSTNTKLAQSFTVDTAGLLEMVDANVFREASPATGSRVWFTIEADSAGRPSGTPLATSDKLDVSIFPNSSNFNGRFLFRSPATLSTSTTYHLVLQGDFTINATNHCKWGGSDAGVYGNGKAQVFDGASWTDITAAGDPEDFWFKIYITRNDAAVTMPSGYDQKCKIGYVYNDSGSNFDAFAQFGRRITPLEERDIGAVTATIPTLTDLSAFIPPIPVFLTAVYANATDSVHGEISPVPSGYVSMAAIDENRRGGGAIMRSNSTSSNPSGLFDCIATDFQGVYLLVGSSTGNFWLSSWEWF